MIITHDGTLLCRCGNTPGSSGFSPCHRDGTADDTLLDADSDRPVFYICHGCGLIGPTVEQAKRFVVEDPDHPEADTASAFIDAHEASSVKFLLTMFD